MTDERIGLHRIGQIRVQVTDIDHAVAFFRDPDGNLLALMSEVPTA